MKIIIWELLRCTKEITWLSAHVQYKGKMPTFGNLTKLKFKEFTKS